MSHDHLLLWVDLETTGLLDTDPVILEIGWALTDLDLNMVAEPQSFYPDPLQTEDFLYDLSDDYVRQMHRASGLWYARRRASTESQLRPCSQIARYIVNDCHFHLNHGGAVTLAGGGVSAFDLPLLRRDYPNVVNMLTYYTIDTSVVERYISMRTGSMRGSSKSAAHRVIPDIQHSIGVAKVINDFMPVLLCKTIMEELEK